MPRFLYIALTWVASFLLPQAFSRELEQISPKVQIKAGGELDAQMAINNSYGAYNQAILPNNTINNSANPASGRIKAMANIEMSIKTKNFRYGAVAGFQSGKNEDDFGSYAREAFVFVEHKYGKFELGSAYSSASKMRVDATQLARATGGIQGDWFRYIALPVYSLSNNLDPSLTMAYNPIFILQPMLPNEAGFTTGAFNGNYVYSNAPYAPVGTTPGSVIYQNTVQPRLGWGSISNKISYYTKRIEGLQIGVSYSPNTGLTGVLPNQQSEYAKDYLGHYYFLNLSGISGNVNNLVTVGLNYIKQFGDFGIATSFTYETGTYQGNVFSSGGLNYSGFSNRNNLNAIAVGIKGIYGPISIAYSYGNWMKSLFSANVAYYNSDGTSAINEAFYHTGGIALSFGPVNLSATYMYSNYRGNQVNLISVGSDLKLRGQYLKNLVPYLELTYYDLIPAYGKTSTGSLLQANPLQGFVFLAGIKFIF